MPCPVCGAKSYLTFGATIYRECSKCPWTEEDEELTALEHGLARQLGLEPK